MSKTFYRFLSLLFIAVILAGCAAPALVADLSREQSPTAPALITPVPGETASAAATPSPKIEDFDGGQKSEPTPDTRLKPEDWRSWPVVPVPSARARQIYQRGLALGNNPAHFSKIGDCQSIREVLMGVFDRPGFYQLTPEHAYLDETIRAFAGSFNRDGQGVQGGFNAASLLSPLWANPEACQPGENPLACEYRTYRPAIVIISLEVWWDGRTPERYEQYMRRIIDYLIERGSLPVLSTKADNVEGDHAINLATARLAYEYDLPLWNWWRAAQELPNGGLDPSRPDGFHLDLSAWTPRSFTALETLDSVWRGVTTGAPSPKIEDFEGGLERETAAPSPKITDLAGAPETEWPQGLRGTLLLGLIQRQGEAEAPLGITAIDLRSGARRQIAPPGYRLQAVSASGAQLLASAGSQLWLYPLDGSAPRLLTEKPHPAAAAAAWLPDGSAAYILAQNGARLLARDPLDGSGWQRLSGAADDPVEIYPSPEPDRVYWGSPDGSAHFSTLAGVSGTLDENIIRPQFSPKSPALAFRRVKSEASSLLVLNRADGSREREAVLPGDMLLDFTWSPDGARISALLLNRSEYSGKALSLNHFIFTPADFGTRQLPKRSGLNPRAAWSADGSALIVFSTRPLDESGAYALQAALIDARSTGELDLSAALGLTFSDFVWVDALAWLPRSPAE